MNIIALVIATFIPLIIGFIWYNPKTFGNAWQKAAGITDEQAKGANMALIFSLTLVFSFIIAFMMQVIVIHQFHFGSILAMQPDFKEPGSVSSELMKQINELYGHSYRTFKHGAFHGTLAGLLLIMPIMAINALFERKGFKYIAINAGYWIVSMALMGGIISAYE
ncbi:MAG: DUF1761 domain-containing protein [Bacteroidia bacterium]